MTKQSLLTVVWVHLGALAWLVSPVSCQEKTGDALKDTTATVKGRVQQNENENLQINLNDFEIRLTQFVLNKMPQPELPKTWQAMTRQQRTDWLRKYEESEKGQALIKRRKQILDSAHTFEIKLEKDGKFVIYDVPPGIYDFRGSLTKEFDGINYFLELTAQIDVQNEVDEVILEPIRISSMPIFKRGNPAPNIEIESFDKRSKVVNKSLAGQIAFLSFWSKEKSPPSVEFLPIVQAMYKALKDRHKLRLFSVCLDEKREDSLAFVKEQKLLGWHGFAGSWDHPTVQAFGVRALPYFCLLDSDGSILMTHQEIRQAYSSGTKLEQIIEKRIRENAGN